MNGLWSRLFGRPMARAATLPMVGLATPATPSPAPRAGVRSPAPQAVVRSPSPRAAEPAADDARLVGAQRPLVSAQGRIAGFEFRLPATLARPHAHSGGGLGTTVGLLAAMRLGTRDDRIALCELPAERLAAAPQAALAPRMMLALTGELPAGADGAALLAGWRAQGAAIGWRDGDAPTALADLRPDFLLLPPVEEPALLLQALRQARARHPQEPLLALDVPDLAAMEALLAAGITYAAGRLEGGRAATPGRTLPPQARPLLQLLSRLAADADTAEIVAAIKTDVALSTRLLARINAAALSPTQELGSIEQAVALLGRNALYGAVSQLLVLTAPPSRAQQALQSMTLARARLFERLAVQRGEPAPGALFTMGLASMLPTLWRAPLADVLLAIPLHPLACHALESNRGPWVDWLLLAHHLDRGHLDAAAGVAERFGGLEAVSAAMAEAWLFAAQGQRAG